MSDARLRARYRLAVQDNDTRVATMLAYRLDMDTASHDYPLRLVDSACECGHGLDVSNCTTCLCCHNRKRCNCRTPKRMARALADVRQSITMIPAVVYACWYEQGITRIPRSRKKYPRCPSPRG